MRKNPLPQAKIKPKIILRNMSNGVFAVVFEEDAFIVFYQLSI
jgi:hypothetical protein